MNIIEANGEEIRLERELKRRYPGHPALKYYGSTWAAIDAYTKALFELDHEVNMRYLYQPSGRAACI